MSNKIRTYDDLVMEQQRLMEVLKLQEDLIKTDIAGVRKGLEPVNNVFNVMSKMATRDNTGPLVNFGLEFGLDLILRKFILAKAGWFTKIAVPYIVKNYTSHILNEEQRDKLVSKVRALFRKLRPKQEPAPEEAPVA